MKKSLRASAEAHKKAEKAERARRKKAEKEEKEKQKRAEMIEKKQAEAKKSEPKKKRTHGMMRRSRLAELAQNKENLSAADRRSMLELTGTNKCNKCLEVKHRSEFYKASRSPTGVDTVHAICAECHYAVLNRNPRANFMRSTLRHCKARAKRKGIAFGLELVDLEELFDAQLGLCALSGQPMTFIFKRTEKNSFVKHGTNMSVDRVDSGAGYTRDNIQLTTSACNVAKLNFTDAEFIAMCRNVVGCQDDKREKMSGFVIVEQGEEDTATGHSK